MPRRGPVFALFRTYSHTFAQTSPGGIRRHIRAYSRPVWRMRAYSHVAMLMLVSWDRYSDAYSQIFVRTVAYSHVFAHICAYFSGEYPEAYTRIFAHIRTHACIPVRSGASPYIFAHIRTHSHLLVHIRASSYIFAHIRTYSCIAGRPGDPRRDPEKPRQEETQANPE